MGKKRDEQGERITALEQMVEAQAQTAVVLEQTIRTLVERITAQDQRMDKHAGVIKALRSQVREMTAAGAVTAVAEADRSISAPVPATNYAGDAADAGATASAGAKQATKFKVSGNVTFQQTGTWVARSECLACGGQKGAGRLWQLTCKPCGQAYQSMIKGPANLRESYSTCLHCGGSKGTSTTLLCTPCRRAKVVAESVTA